MPGGGWGSGDVAAPVEVDRAGQVGLEVVGPRVALESEPAVHDPHLWVAEPRGDLLGRPEEVRAGERAHRDNLAVLRGNLRRALILARLRTHRGEPLAVTLYERAGCHLCEETHRALRRGGPDPPPDARGVDTTTPPPLPPRDPHRSPRLPGGGGA